MLCKHSAVSAARTRRHYAVVRTIAQRMRECAHLMVRLEPHVGKPKAAGAAGAPQQHGTRRECRADLWIHDLRRHRLQVVDVKVIDEYAACYRANIAGAVVAKERAAEAAYGTRVGRRDVRAWVITVGGRVGPHAMEDLGEYAKAMRVTKGELLAEVYASVLKERIAQ